VTKLQEDFLYFALVTYPQRVKGFYEKPIPQYMYDMISEARRHCFVKDYVYITMEDNPNYFFYVYPVDRDDRFTYRMVSGK
jgi:hypothetical protein